MKFVKGKKEKKKQPNQDMSETIRITPDKVDYVEADYREGLNQRQVDERMNAGWTNRPVDSSAKTVKEIIKENICTYFNLIFSILAVILCLVGSFNSLTFLPVIIVNTLIGIIQEIRAKRTLDKMNIMAAPKATVVRSGRVRTVKSEDLVIDDIVVFKAGNQICADAEVVVGEVQVNESLLTGEADEITKREGDGLVSGSFVVSGQCCARLTAVGEDSYISKLTLEAKAMKNGEQSEMIRSLDKILKFIGIALIPIGIALFIQSFAFNGTGITRSVTSTVAALIGMIPEGLYLLTSVALAVSSMRLARKRVLLHDIKSIETLARVDVLCVDKTGTITENTMEVKELIVTDEYRQGAMPPVEGLIGDFVAAMSSDNITMEAMKEHFKESAGLNPRKVTPFSSTVKYSGVTFDTGAYVMGAPEMVLREDFYLYEEEINAYTARGYRVLAFCLYEGEITGKSLTARAIPLGYILLANPIREAAPETFAYFEEQGVEIKVISGDNPLTVSEAAREAHIKGAERYVDAGTLRTAEDIERAMEEYNVFGRVTPEQKRQFVKALQRQGHTVAMTGDGVNDVLALKDADCSVAMASGSEAAANASQVVLLDSDFSCMPDVVLEGRRVVNNMERSASLFLVKNIFSFLLSLFSLLLGVTYPLEPSQISLISTFTVGIPAFFLALQPNSKRISGRFLPNVFFKALPGGITSMAVVGALVVFGNTFDVGSEDISTASAMLVAIIGFMVLCKISQPSRTWHWIVIIGSMAGLVVCIIFFAELFSIGHMSVKCVMLLVVFSVATEPVLRYLILLFEKMRDLYIKGKEKLKR